MPVLLDARQPCRHCGKLCKPTGLKLHERACPKNANRRLPARPVVPAVPAEPPSFACANCSREGTPAISRPEWCKPCVASGGVLPAPEPEPPATRLITCSACGREGTPSRRDPALCVGCGISPETAIVRREMFPPRSGQSEITLSVLQAGPGEELAQRLRPRYLRARALDFGILEVRR